jgi:hypothetical protein
MAVQAQRQMPPQEGGRVVPVPVVREVVVAQLVIAV